MEIKPPDEITEADIPHIETPLHATSRISHIFEGFGSQHLTMYIKGLDDLVRDSMFQNYLGDMRIQSAYWEYFKSGGRARHQEYDFNNPIKDQILKDFKWGKFLIVLDHGSSQAEGHSPLFKKNTSLGIAKQNQWQQVSDGSPSTDFIGFESILNRHHKDRTQRPHPFYGGGTGESEAKEIVSTPEPWPEQSGQREAFVGSPTAQPSAQFAPNTQPSPQPTETEPSPRKPANDPNFDLKKGLWLLRLLKGAGIAAILTEFLFPGNDIPEQWEDENGVTYDYNPDDFKLVITQPDGTKEVLRMPQDGTVTDQNGAIVGSVDKDGNFEPVTEQEEVEYRVWKANGGDGSFAVWKNSGKPSEIDADKSTNTKTRLPRENGKWDGEPGEGKWYSDLDEVNEVTGGEPVPFANGRPDFSEWSKGEVTFKKGELNGTDEDFSKVYEKIAKDKGLKNKTEAKKLLKEKGLTPHHLDDETIQLIPTKLHRNIPHVGSASDMRNTL